MVILFLFFCKGREFFLNAKAQKRKVSDKMKDKPVRWAACAGRRKKGWAACGNLFFCSEKLLPVCL